MLDGVYPEATKWSTHARKRLHATRSPCTADAGAVRGVRQVRGVYPGAGSITDVMLPSQRTIRQSRPKALI